MISSRAAAPLVLLLLSSCTLGPDHSSPQISLPAKFAEGSSASNGDVATNAWWTAFSDSRLNGYVEQGLSQNLDVLQALERINQAQAAVVTAGAGGLPSLDVGAQASRSGSTDIGGPLSPTTRGPTTSVDGGPTASWFLDLFGLYRRSKEAAVAELDASYASVDVARMTLLSQVTAAYIDVRFYQERIALTRQNLESRRETLNLTKLQLEAGAASRLDVVQAEGLVNTTLSDLPGLETQFRLASHRIATLLGLPASSLVSELQRGARQPVARFSPRSGVPADLIRNRPDVRAAERRLAAATARIGVAEAQLFPAITLGGSITPSYTNTSSRGENGILSWSFGPAISLPIFDGGALKANVKSNESLAREAYLAWKQTVLTGVEEVENALAAVARDGRTVSALRNTVRSYEEALELATASYRDGASSLLDVLDAQRQVSDSQASLAAAVQQMAQDYVSLNVAIGSGYAVGSASTQVASAKVVKD
jgi:outer membrane protein, multidrug efflux system